MTSGLLEAKLDFDDISRAYTEDDAQLIEDSIRTSLDGSIGRLPLSGRVEHVDIVTRSNHEWGAYDVGGVANYTRRSLVLYINPSRSAFTVVRMLPGVVEHEIAHQAHYDLNPWSVDRTQPFWTMLVREGVSEFASFQLDHDYKPESVFELPKAKTDDLMQMIKFAASHTGRMTRATKYEFLGDGTTGAVSRGYEAAHYLVASMAAVYGYSVEDAMQVGLEEYRSFAGVKS